MIAIVQTSHGAASDEDQRLYDEYQARTKAESELFYWGRVKFSPRLRTAAILSACGKVGLVKSIEPSASETSKFLGKELVRMMESKSSQYVVGLTPNEFFWVVNSVTNQLARFREGVREGIELIKDKVQGICDAAVSSADKILQEGPVK